MYFDLLGAEVGPTGMRHTEDTVHRDTHLEECIFTTTTTITPIEYVYVIRYIATTHS